MGVKGPSLSMPQQSAVLLMLFGELTFISNFVKMPTTNQDGAPKYLFSSLVQFDIQPEAEVTVKFGASLQPN